MKYGNVDKLELKVALQVMRDYSRLVKVGSSRASSPEWVFRVYRAVHKVFPEAIAMFDEDEVRALRLTKPGVANHYFTMMNDLWLAVEKGGRFATPSCISLELIQTSSRLQDREVVSKSLGRGLTSAVNDDSPTDTFSKNFGRGSGTYVEIKSDFRYIKIYDFIAKWSRLENHLNDMVNVCLATGTAIGGDIGDTLETGKHFT